MSCHRNLRVFNLYCVQKVLLVLRLSIFLEILNKYYILEILMVVRRQSVVSEPDFWIPAASTLVQQVSKLILFHMAFYFDISKLGDCQLWLINSMSVFALAAPPIGVLLNLRVNRGQHLLHQYLNNKNGKK